MKIKGWIIAAMAVVWTFSSCSNETESSNSYTPKGDYDSGILVLNEGRYDQNEAEVTFVSFDLSRVDPQIFHTENSALQLGKTAQSIGFNGNLAYLVVNGSDKIEVVNRYSFQSVGTIQSGLHMPRYIAFANGKAFVTNWASFSGSGFVAVINLATNTVETTIPVADFPNKILAQNGKVYVAHNDLASVGNTITVIDAATKAVTGSIEVGDMPDAMCLDERGALWVACNGKSSYPVPANETAGALLKIDLNSQAVVRSFSLTQQKHLQHMDVFGNHVFYVVDNQVYKMPLTETTLPTSPAFTTSAQYVYGFAVRNNRIYVADAKGFNQNGSAYVYASGDGQGPGVGTLIRTLETGIGPNGFYFNL